MEAVGREVKHSANSMLTPRSGVFSSGWRSQTLENTPVFLRKYLAFVYTTATSVRMRAAPYFHSYKLLHSSNSGIAVIARCI